MNGLQIGATATLSLVAWGFLLIGALNPFRRIVNSRREQANAAICGLVGLGLLAAAFWVGTIGINDRYHASTKGPIPS